MIHDKKIKVKIGVDGVGVKTTPLIKGILKYIKVITDKPVAIIALLDNFGELVINEYVVKNKLYAPKTQGDVGVEHKKYSFDTADYVLNDTITFGVSGQRDVEVTFLVRWVDAR